MTGLRERIGAAASACAEAIEALDARVQFATPGGGGHSETWDCDKSVAAVERVNTAFEELGPLENWADGLDRATTDSLRVELIGLARLHSLLVFTVAREKDALRDRLLLAGTAARAERWHDDTAAGGRCNLSG